MESLVEIADVMFSVLPAYANAERCAARSKWIEEHGPPPKAFVEACAVFAAHVRNANPGKSLCSVECVGADFEGFAVYFNTLGYKVDVIASDEVVTCFWFVIPSVPEDLLD